MDPFLPQKKNTNILRYLIYWVNFNEIGITDGEKNHPNYHVSNIYVITFIQKKS